MSGLDAVFCQWIRDDDGVWSHNQFADDDEQDEATS